MSEKIVMPVLEFDPKISFQFLGERCTIRPIFIAKTVLALTAFVVHIIFLERNLLVLDSIFNLVFNVVWVSLLPCTAVYLAKHLSDDNSVYKATVEVDAQMNANIVAQRDWLLVLMAALYPCLTGSLTANTFLGEDSRYNIPYCIMSMICSSVLTVAINKYLISKRLKHLRTADAFVDRAEDTILISRRLLDLDKTLNSTYAPLAAVSVIYTFQDLLMTLYSIWTTYGAHMVLLYDPFGVYGFCTLFVVFECVVGVALAYSSSIIADEVDELKLELDITRTARSVTATENKLIYLFLMELHHTPVVMSGLGLFDISPCTISVVCATMISYMLVLIQYT